MTIQPNSILVTGVAGFIGFHVAQRLLAQGHQVYGIDNLNAYYDVNLKHARLIQLLPQENFSFQALDISNRKDIAELFAQHKFTAVVHLAAQAGVRYSIENPHAYIDSNLQGYLNILEGCRHHQIAHLIYASSSSVYGNSDQAPFSTDQNVDYPISLYAATKKANELMAHTYSHLYQIPTTGLRFFTVYGPWGRPDMAYFKFVQAIAKGQPIEVYNQGEMWRDFTYIDDVVEGICRLIPQPPQPNLAHFRSPAPYRVYNIGNHQPVKLLDFISMIEQALGQSAHKIFLPLQPGDVLSTFADVEDLTRDTGFQPNTPLQVGINKFVEWYQAYYQAAGSGQPLGNPKPKIRRDEMALLG